jgi:hypothetical protein
MERGRLTFGRSTRVERASTRPDGGESAGPEGSVRPMLRRARRAAARSGESRIVITTKSPGLARRSTAPFGRILDGRRCRRIVVRGEQTCVCTVDVKGLLGTHSRLAQALALRDGDRPLLWRVAARQTEGVPCLPPLHGVRRWRIGPDLWPRQWWLVHERFHGRQVTHTSQSKRFDLAGRWEAIGGGGCVPDKVRGAVRCMSRGPARAWRDAGLE